MEDWEVAVLVIGCVVGGTLLSNCAFYSATGRLPHFVRNLLRLPPVCSCGPIDAKDHHRFDHTRVTGRLFCVSILPQMIIIILLILAMYAEVPDLPVDDWHGMRDATRCAAAVAKEQSLAVAVSGGDVPEAVAASFTAAQAVTDTDCNNNRFGSGRTHLTSARAGATSGDLSVVATAYRDAFAEVRTWAANVNYDVLEDGEKEQVGELGGLMTAGAVSSDCGALVSSTAHTAGHTSQSTDRAQLSAPAEYLSLRGADSTFSRVQPLFEQAARETEESAYTATRNFHDDPAIDEVRKRAVASMRSLSATQLTAEQQRLMASNMTAMLEKVAQASQEHTEPELQDTYEAMKKDRNELLGLCGFGIAICFLCIFANTGFILNHRRSMQGSIVIRQDFDNAQTNKHVFTEYVQQFEAMRVERFAGEAKTKDGQKITSMVERAFWALGFALLQLKPFLSHSLFAGELDADDDHETSANRDKNAGGRTALYSVKLEVGMHFSRCSVMAVCTEMFNDLSTTCITEKRADIASDYEQFIRLVTSAAASTGGVVHKIGGSTIACTWNCTVTCDRSQERACDAAFLLDDTFLDANAGDDDGRGLFNFVPADEPLQISVSSGEVMAGVIKTVNSKTHLIIGPPLLIAERMLQMCPFHAVPVLIDQETEKRVKERWYTKPVYRMMTKEGEQIVYEIRDEEKPVRDNRLREYKDAFNLYKRNKRDEAMEAFEKYLQSLKQQKQSDKSAKAILDRLRADKRKEDEKLKREGGYQGMMMT